MFTFDKNPCSRCLRMGVHDGCEYAAEIVQKKEGAWHYALPKIKEEITTIAIGLDGTCMHLKKKVGEKR